MNHKSEVKGYQQQIQKLKEELAATKIENTQFESKLLANQEKANEYENQIKYLFQAIPRPKW